ncbi:MAG: hypothetical protein LC778_06100 [Acidobacteria bacterium]|nr:hypothetical protein [Acidobacteriota bacterium]
MKRAVKTEETAKNGRKSGARRASTAVKNARVNGNKTVACGASPSNGELSAAKIRKMTKTELRKEIGRVGMEFINCEE